MNPQGDSGRAPDDWTSDDAAGNEVVPQAVSRPVTFYVGTSDESDGESEDVGSDESDTSGTSDTSDTSDTSPNSAPDSEEDGTANTGEGGASNATGNAGLTDASYSSDPDHDDEDEEYSEVEQFHSPEWHLQPLDAYGRPRDFVTFRPSILRGLVASCLSRKYCYVFHYMMQAVYCGKEEVVSTLLTLGVNPNDPRARLPDGSTLLHVAANRCHASIVHLLLRHGASVDAACKKLCTALHVAAIPGCLKSTAILLSAGANVYARDVYGHSPICYALTYGHDSVVRALQAFRVVWKSKCKHGKDMWKGKDKEASSEKHSFMLLFPRG